MAVLSPLLGPRVGSQHLSSSPHLAATAALSCMVCIALSGASHLGQEQGHLGIQEEALAQGIAQADLHPSLPRHTSHFSNWHFLKMHGYLLQCCKCCEFVGLGEMQEEMLKGCAYARCEQPTLVAGFAGVFTVWMTPEVERSHCQWTGWGTAQCLSALPPVLSHF